MIENHVAAAGNVQRFRAVGSQVRRAKPQIAHNHVLLIAERYALTANRNALARGRLTGDGKVAGKSKVRFKIDDTPDIEHDNAMRLTDRVAQRTGAGIVEIGHMVHGPTAAATGSCAEALGARKGQRLGAGR